MAYFLLLILWLTLTATPMFIRVCYCGFRHQEETINFACLWFSIRLCNRIYILYNMKRIEAYIKSTIEWRNECFGITLGSDQLQIGKLELPDIHYPCKNIYSWTFYSHLTVTSHTGGPQITRFFGQFENPFLLSDFKPPLVKSLLHVFLFCVAHAANATKT